MKAGLCLISNLVFTAIVLKAATKDSTTMKTPSEPGNISPGGRVSSTFKAVSTSPALSSRVNKIDDSTAQIPDACYALHSKFASTTFPTQR